jgi:L-ascorbate metabolism protein UlaG (beta-lactamase superfamily)
MQRVAVILVFVLIVLARPAIAAEPTTVTWHGHAAFEIKTPTGTVLLIDPWLTNPMNPAAKDKQDPVAKIEKADFILITHGHFDHVGDAVALAKKTGARLVATFELGMNMAKLLGYPKEQMGFDSLMNIGGEIALAGGEVIVAMTPAVHSSGVQNPNAKEGDADLVYGGNPVGFVLKIKNGPVIYHSGDTAYFRDMELIGESSAPDLALLNAGGHFGMEPKMAARAAASVKAKLSVPHHYATFPVLAQGTKPFTDAMTERGLRFRVLAPGASILFDGAEPRP